MSNQLREKTSSLIDNFQLGLINGVDRKDLTDLLQINDRFKGLALEKPEKRIISTDLAEVNYFLHIIQFNLICVLVANAFGFITLDSFPFMQN